MRSVASSLVGETHVEKDVLSRLCHETTKLAGIVIETQEPDLKSLFELTAKRGVDIFYPDHTEFIRGRDTMSSLTKPSKTLV